MLRVCNLAGETLATFSADEVEDKIVHQLKTSLAKQFGATRFQQKWFAEDHTELQDDDVVPCRDVQLVVVDFVPAQPDEFKQLISACRENRLDELVHLIRKPLNPQGVHEKPEFLEALEWAAENGHSQIVQLLFEAGVNANDALAFKLHRNYDFECDEVGENRTALVLAVENGRTALHLAAMGGHSEVVQATALQLLRLVLTKRWLIGKGNRLGI